MNYTEMDTAIIQREAEKLVEKAQALGVVVAIDIVSHYPPRTGKFDMVAHTRPARHKPEPIPVLSEATVFATPSSMTETDPNAPWLTLAHIICSEAGIAPGNIEARLTILRQRMHEQSQLDSTRQVIQVAGVTFDAEEDARVA
jgi:hypothetical protein